MTVFAAACRRVQSTTRHRIVLSRAFHASRRAHVIEDRVAVKRSRPSVTVTKKLFSELPKRRVLEPSTPSALNADTATELPPLINAVSSIPLVDHDHAKPEASIEPTKGVKRGRQSKSVVSPVEVATEIPPAPSRRRRRKAVASDDLPSEDPPPLSAETVEESPTPRRRARQPTTLTTNEASNEDDSRTSASWKQPRNMLATGILANLSRFPHCILLTRVGQFYESYFDQANEVARLLGIKLTSRVWDKQDVAMCGFPIMHLDKHLKVLVQQHKRFVAMCEEFPRYTDGQKPEFERRVSRVITPGTLIDEPFLNHFENNYLMSISPAESPDGEAGLAWIDVSTGEFFTKTTILEGLKDELARIGPREIVLAEELRDQTSHPVRQMTEDEGNLISYIRPSAADEVLPPSGDLVSPSGSPAAPIYTAQESSAIEILTSYLRANLLEHMPQLSTPNREGTGECMQIDSHTIKALEIRESTREGGTTGSLLNVVRRTVTSSGARSLARKLCSPSTSVKEIEARQSLVAFFHDRPHLRDDVVRSLADAEDASRIVQKFLLGKGEPRDLLSINRTIQVWSTIQKRIDLERKMEKSERGVLQDKEWSSIEALMSRITSFHGLSVRIAAALYEVELAEPSPDASTEGDAFEEADKMVPTNTYGTLRRTIRPEFSKQLTKLHNTLNDVLERRRILERDLQIQYGAPSLTLRTSPSQGMHVHIGRTKRDQAKIKSSPSFVGISESASTSTYFYQPWSQLGSQIVETTIAISNAEKEVFSTLRNEVKAFSTQLRLNARIMDELDVTLGFAKLATELRFVRPVIEDDAIYEVIKGRHPTVERGLLTSGRVFTPNSVALKPNSRLHVITGPNMAGKSTFLRQTALIAILAQTGSFVPADHAVVGVVDKLFSRVGAKDDLFRDRSTFMVEMLETAEILRRATPKSLVIMDEVGRGTTVKDGLAIAFATVHHLTVHNRCRALFATHFHELTDMLAHAEDHHHGSGVFREVGFFCTDVHETEDNYFSYSHRLRPGVNRDSHGLKVAQLAGMPESVVHLAKSALSALQGRQHMDATQLSALGQELTAE